MRTKGSFYTLVLFTLLLFIFPWSELSTAQNAEGALTGIVEDTSGARIAGARVLLSVPDSPFQRQTVTSSVGEFRLEALPPGDYYIGIRMSGSTTALSYSSGYYHVEGVPTLHFTSPSPEGSADTMSFASAMYFLTWGSCCCGTVNET